MVAFLAPGNYTAVVRGKGNIECGWVVLNVQTHGWKKLVRYLGFAPDLSGAAAGWIAAALVVATFVAFSLQLPSVRANRFRPSFLKLLAIALAIGAGILEEVSLFLVFGVFLAKSLTYSRLRSLNTFAISLIR